MKKYFILFVAMLLTLFPIFSETIFVLDFDTEINDYEDNAVIMSDMLRSELVNTRKFSVVDKKSMNAAIKTIEEQMSEYMSRDNVKQIGKMLNADYLVIGHVLTLSNRAADTVGSKNMFINKMEKVISGNDKVEVIVQLLNIETLEVLASSSVELNKWTDFSRYTKKIANDLTSRISSSKNASNAVLENIKRANADMLEGVWTCEIVHDGITDSYTVTFDENRKVTIEIISTTKKGKITEASGNGRYTFNDNEKILTVTVNSLSGNIKHLKNINWKSYLNPSNDEEMFTYNIPVSSGNSQNVKVEFFKE